MRAVRGGLELIPFAAMCVLALAPRAAAVQPLRLSNDDRFLVQADGTPFFWTGDTNWRLYKLDQAQVDVYLDDRRARGFNVIQGPVLLHNDEEPSIEFTNPYGQTNNSASNPNLAWFDHIDYIINAAEQRGMYVAPVVIWSGNFAAFGNSQSQRVANAREFGEWLGNRYSDHNNVIWVVGGEYTAHGTGIDTRQVWNAVATGLRTGHGNTQLMTIHGGYQEGLQSSSLLFHDAGWLSFNMIQSSQSGNVGAGAANWHLISSDYDLEPVKPVLDGEAHYEGLAGWNAFGVRRRAYWSVFAGAFGHTYGAIPVAVSYRGGDDEPYYGITQTWEEALDWPGGNDMRHLRNLMESRPMLKRIPADSMIVTPAGNVPDRMIATRDRFGRYAMIYVPKKDKTFIINTNALAGTHTRCWWYDCRNGVATGAGTIQQGGFQTFTTPDEGQDWVLVLDDRDEGFPQPGNGGPLP